MGQMRDFKCTYDNASGFGEWVSEETGITFPEAYTEREAMLRLALAVKRHQNVNWCQLPFCHTVEAETLGGNVRMGNGVVGPRAGSPICRTLEEVLALPDLDDERSAAGRLAETLEACKELKAMGETVVFLVSGPMTILGGLVDSQVLFRALRKSPELVMQVFEKIERVILEVIRRAEAAGVDAISYADSAGGVNLIGPKAGEMVARQFTYGLLRRVDQMLKPETIVLLCPKTALALLDTEQAVWRDHKLPESMGYCDAVLSMRGQVRFTGQSCVNNVHARLEERILRELALCEPPEGEA